MSILAVGRIILFLYSGLACNPLCLWVLEQEDNQQGKILSMSSLRTIDRKGAVMTKAIRHFYNPIWSYYRPNRKHFSMFKALSKMLKSMLQDIYYPIGFWIKRTDESFLYTIGKSKSAPFFCFDIRTKSQFDKFIEFCKKEFTPPYKPFPEEIYLYVNDKRMGETPLLLCDGDIEALEDYATDRLILREAR